MSDINQDDIIQALHENDGIIKTTAASLGISRVTLWRRMKDNERLQAEKRSAKEQVHDEVESRMLNLIRDPAHKDHWKALRYYTKTQMQDRGFSDNVDVTSAGEKINGATIIIQSEGETPDIE